MIAESCNDIIHLELSQIRFIEALTQRQRFFLPFSTGPKTTNKSRVSLIRVHAEEAKHLRDMW